MENNFLPYSRQWINSSDIEEVVKSLRSDWISQGPKVEEFEKAMADFCRVQYSAAVSSGTAGLHLAYKAAGIKENDEVITTPLTFAATSSMLVHLGAKPVFVDVEKDTFNIDPKKIEKKITERTKAISIVDFRGHSCDFDRIKETAEKHNLLIIEDAAHSLGSEYKGKRIGGLADLTVFSFHPVKNITTGEGGMILTNNKDFYEKIKVLRHHNIIKKPEKGKWYYEIEDGFFNYRLTDFQSALGISQLKKLNRFVKRRREIVEKYNKMFKDIKGIETPVEKDYSKSAWHIYVILIENRDKIFENLTEKGIGVQVHYIPLHFQPFFQKRFGYKKGDFPAAEKYYQKAITLPLFPQMNDEDVKRVIDLVKNEVSKKQSTI